MKRPLGSSLADFGKLLPAEARLLECCRKGEQLKLSDKRPDKKSRKNTVRATFLRFLALGGDENAPVHAVGVNLSGAFVEGNFDLSGTDVAVSIWIDRSTFSDAVEIFDAKLKLLSLAGSKVSALRGDRVVVKGGLLLREGFVSAGHVRLAGALIDGDCDLTEAAVGSGEGDVFSTKSDSYWECAFNESEF